MNRLVPQAPYEEDQPHATAILTTHVLLRGFQTGAVLGLPLGLFGNLYLRRRPGNAKIVPLLPSIVRATGFSCLVGTGLLGFALVGRMWGREDIEWRDRSWRLLGNKGQNESDEWAVAGMVSGLGIWTGMSVGRMKGLGGWKIAVGSVGTGGTLGLLGYLVYRHGIKGGNWEEKEVEVA